MLSEYTAVLWRCAVRVSGIGGTVPCGWSLYTEPGTPTPVCPHHSTGGMENLGEFDLPELVEREGVVNADG